MEASMKHLSALYSTNPSTSACSLQVEIKSDGSGFENVISTEYPSEPPMDDQDHTLRGDPPIEPPPFYPRPLPQEQRAGAAMGCSLGGCLGGEFNPQWSPTSIMFTTPGLINGFANALSLQPDTWPDEAKIASTHCLSPASTQSGLCFAPTLPTRSAPALPAFSRRKNAQMWHPV
jgi:hypothetical protein